MNLILISSYVDLRVRFTAGLRVDNRFAYEGLGTGRKSSRRSVISRAEVID